MLLTPILAPISRSMAELTLHGEGTLSREFHLMKYL